jgi:hypothetical protein
MKIVILGWGSLLWDAHLEFDSTHGSWESEGPRLPLEFSRVSASRGGALTLVVDHQSGVTCTSVFSVSTRKHPDDAIADLPCREGTTLENIGYCFPKEGRKRSHNPQTLAAIEPWAREKYHDVVIWTDLISNFATKSTFKVAFTVPNAIAHLQALPTDAKAKAAEYIWRAPSFIDTPLRREVQVLPWFKVDG